MHQSYSKHENINVARLISFLLLNPLLDIWQVSLFSTEVYKGTYNGQAVAVKKLKDDSETAQAFLSEASVMT